MRFIVAALVARCPSLECFAHTPPSLPPPAVPGGAFGAGGLPGVQAGPAQRVPAPGGPAAGPGPLAHQDRRQQDAQDLRLPHPRGLHQQGLAGRRRPSRTARDVDGRAGSRQSADPCADVSRCGVRRRKRFISDGVFMFVFCDGGHYYFVQCSLYSPVLYCVWYAFEVVFVAPLIKLLFVFL